MEKIRSGQAFLYRDGGLNSTVIEVKINGRVNEGALNQALRDTVKRYPYFASKLVERDGDYYIADNSAYPLTAKFKATHALGSMSAGFHLVEVSYQGEYVRVSFHHAFCDGLGVKPFVETLIHRYFCLLKHKDFAPGNVRTVDSLPFDDETAEPFVERYEVGEFEAPTVVKDGFMLPECQNQFAEDVRYRVEIGADEFMSYARANNATPSIFLAYLFSKAVTLNNEAVDKRVVTSVAADMRSELGVDHTHKNCVRSVYLSFGAEQQSKEAREVCTHMRRELAAQREPNYIRATANSFIGLSDKLDTMGTLEEKRAFMSFFNEMTINTYVISYMGTFDFGASGVFVDSVRLYSGGIKGITLNAVHFGGKFYIDLIMNIDGGKYVNTFAKLLRDIDVPCVSETACECSTPKDQTRKTARYQSERFQIKRRKKVSH